MKWRDAIAQVLDSVETPGLLHYLDLTAAVVERWPEFGPGPGRITPQNTMYRVLVDHDDFEQLGDGWFRVKRWGATSDRLTLTADGGAALARQARELKAAADSARPSTAQVLLDDPARRAAEVERRSAALLRARDALVRDPLTTDDVATFLAAWALTGGNDPDRDYHNRFGVAFKGVYLKRYQEQLSTVAEWITELRGAGDDAAVAGALDRLWARGDLDMAGSLFPTMVLHTLDPERWFPWTPTLGRGLERLDPTVVPERSGAGYLAYCQAVRSLLAAEGLGPHLADLLLVRASAEGDPVEDEDEVAAVGGFSEATFGLLAELGRTPNVRKEWFEVEGRRAIWQNNVRRPLAELVERVGRDLLVPLVNQSEAIAPDRFVVDPKRVLGKPNSQSPRANGSYYYPYLWAAFFPESQERRQVAGQLFVVVHGGGLEVGVSLSSAPAQVRERFVRQLERYRDQIDAHWRASELAGRVVLRPFTLDQGPAGEGASLEDVAAAAAIAEVDEPTSSLCVRWTPEQVVSPGFDAEVDAAARLFVPFLVLATTDEAARALERLGVEAPGVEEPEAAPVPVGYSMERLVADTHLPRRWLEEVVNAARFEKDSRGSLGQVILYGPPGTGKTWLAERIALHLADGDRARVEVVQFHPAFAYEHFVEGFQPDVEGGNMVFRRRKGVLRELADRVVQTGKRHVLVIDEINRGDLPQIFGELMYLLSRRGTGAEVRLGRSRDLFSLPDRLVILGTMNTADRSIAHVDFALRRRFRFVLVKPEPEVLAATAPPDRAAFGAALGSLLALVNDRLRAALPGGGLQIGHAYLLGVGGIELLEEVWRGEIYPSIEDYLDHDPDRLRPFEWKSVKVELARHLAEAGEDPGGSA